MTDPIQYKEDGFDRWYRRIGENIHFNGNKPPKGIEIYPNSINTVNQGLHSEFKVARVIGWETKTVYCDTILGTENVAAKIKDGKRVFDTHNFVEVSKITSVKATIPCSGKYKISYEVDLEKGDEININNVNKFQIWRK